MGVQKMIKSYVIRVDRKLLVVVIHLLQGICVGT